MTNFVSQIGKYCSKKCCDDDKRIDPTERFWPRVNKAAGDECWLWIGAVGSDGYGKFWHNGITTHAHRAAYEITYGAINDPYVLVCHRCDTPLCVRPDHLFLGTHQDNTNDMIAKNRAQRGDNHWSRRRPDRIPRGKSHWTQRKAAK